MDKQISRREFLKQIGLAGAAVTLAACTPATTAAPTNPPAPTNTTAPTQPPATATPVPVPKNALGVDLPADAAPWAQQIDVSYGEFGPWEHWAEGIYGLGGGSVINYYTQENLLTLDSYGKLVPMMAETWEANADATVWTFHLRKGLQWSDGTPITANDWVYTFQYQADPANGFDFNWYYDPINNLDKAAKGDVKPTEIGVAAKDDQTLVFTLKAATPYWPALMVSAFPLPKQAVEKGGKRVWSTNPATSVASGPYILKTYERDKIAICELNKNYKGIAKPVVTHYAFKYSPNKSTDWWALYQNDEITNINLNSLAANVQEEVKNDAKYKDQLIINPAADIFYITFDVTKPPFDKKDVRQAFALSINRETICTDVLKGTCTADYSFLPVGFPGWQGDKLQPIQAYDVAKAKQLLAGAGFPDGKGFPDMTFYVRGDTPVPAEAVVAMWQENLGIKLGIETFDRTNFMQKMMAHQFQIYQLAYGADFPDPINLLSLFLTSTKRHEWTNAQYDDLLTKSSTETDATARGKLLFDAETILLQDYGVIPVFSEILYVLYKPWFHTKIVDDKRAGGKAWPGYNFFHLANQYYTKDTPKAWPPVDPNYLA